MGGGYRVLAAASLPWFLPCPVPFCTLYVTHCPLVRELSEFSQQLGILGPPLKLQACVHCAWAFLPFFLSVAKLMQRHLRNGKEWSFFIINALKSNGSDNFVELLISTV